MGKISNPPKPIEKPYRVLSLDGGGTRGIYTAEFLDQLVTYYARIRKEEFLDLGKGFDLITGTSTGAIVGCALAVGKPLSEVVKLYKENGKKIFPHRIKDKKSALFRACRGNRYVKAGDAALRSALKEVLGDTTMLDVYEKRGISLSIPTVNMSTHRAWVFKKTDRSGVRDDLYPLADVCLASSAAPIYRSLASIPDRNSKHDLQKVFADGGLWANNPILVGLIDALSNAQENQPIEIFSLGTCPKPEGETISPEEAHRSMLGWSLGADVAPLSIAAQEFAFDNMARFLANQFSALGRPISLVRFPKKEISPEMIPYLALDDARNEAMTRLMQQASHDADMTKSACDDPNSKEGQLINTLMYSIPSMIKTGIDWKIENA